MADVFAPPLRGIHLQGAIIGDLFAWAEVSHDGRRVDWCVTARDEPVDWGSDRIPGAWTEEARGAALEARMRLLVYRYGGPGGQTPGSPLALTVRAAHGKEVKLTP